MVRATVSKKRPASSDESESENEYQVEAIVDKRSKGKRIQYLLKWKGYSDADNTWEDHTNLNCPDLVKEFEDKQKNNKSKTPSKTRPSRSKKVKVDSDDEAAAAAESEKVDEKITEKENDDVEKEQQTPTKARLRSASKSESIVDEIEDKTDENQNPNETSVEIINKNSPAKESLLNEPLGDPPGNLRLRITPNSNSPISLTLNDSDNNNNNTTNDKSTIDTDIEITEINNEDEEPVEKIEGVRNSNDGIYFRIKLNRHKESQWISAKIANRKYPQSVIAFWENHVEFT